MQMCRTYPGSHVKTVRSHIMKFFYKYFLKNPDLRERTAVTNSYDGFEQIVAELKARVTDDSEYNEVIVQMCQKSLLSYARFMSSLISKSSLNAI